MTALLPEDTANAVLKAKLLEALMQGMPVSAACRYAGVNIPTGHRWAKEDPWIRERLSKKADNSIYKAKTSRADVEDILLEAVDIARIKAEPGDMIRGASEIGKLHGYYAPQEKKVTFDGEINVNQLEDLSDAELLELTGEELSPIEAEFHAIEYDDAEEA